MDIQQYILSGVIETYVLGLATEQEAKELELLCSQYPEIKAAVQSYQEALEAYATLHATPPPGLKDKIWKAIDEGKQSTGNTGSPKMSRPLRRRKIILRHASNNWQSYLIAASIALLIGSMGLNLIYLKKSQHYKAQLDELTIVHSISEELGKTYAKQIAEYEQELKVLSSPYVRSILLEGVPQHQESKASILWDTRSKEVYMALGNLPSPPAGKQYQLWAIVDGKPVDAGIYNSKTDQRLQKMKTIQRAEMFAITLEREGGSPQPTMDQMYVAAKI